MNRKDRRAARARSGAARGVPPDPAAVRALLQQGMAHHQRGNLGAAAAAYGNVLALHKDNADALNLLGLTYHQQGDNRQALALIERAAGIAPGNPMIHNNLGIVLRALRRDDESVERFRQAVALDAGYTQARINLGNALSDAGRTGEAIAVFEDALDRAPDNAEVHAAMALALTAEGALEEAGPHFSRAAALAPTVPVLHFLLGNHFYHGGDDAAAADALRRAVDLDPAYREAWSRLGFALRRTGRPEEAVGALRKAVQLCPEDAESEICLAGALRDLRRVEEALDTIDAVLDRSPGLAEAHNERAYILRCLGREDEAGEAYSRAAALDPDHPHAIANRAHVHLAEGRFDEGWRDYLRDRAGARARNACFEGRLPDALAGRRVLLVRDQGLGDQIFFLRFARALQVRGPTVLCLSPSKIASLLARIPDIDAVIDEAAGEEPPADYRILTSDLPYALGMTHASDIPPSLSLPILPDRAALIRERLAAFGPPPYIGVTWRAGVQQFARLSKEAPADEMARLLMDVPGTAVVLQRNPLPGETARFADRLGRPVCDMTALNEDLEEMLALLDALDDYVCVSNTNVHLRAARGRPCRVLVPYPAEFRWMSRGDESPWFPGTRLYRQRSEDGWETALRSLAADLTSAFPKAT